MTPAIEKLTQFLVELEASKDFGSLEEEVDHIGVINQVRDAIGQLKLCEKHGITGGSLVSVLPETGNPNFCYLVVH
ncbi:hypothetical protein [Motiliproteus sp. MSK22-1]|uniref:hypothetical protein n=1 Tax=Motiliproteus sp. MSK22-1 TaxID=1897630 RepID=UPI0009781CA3|nr:hypothetical protein [Motiliproteus sp. MSK22-1]OMH37993.1 hypothetical protein BGP75_06815 [Motiliproteus sp. MSK22-1]